MGFNPFAIGDSKEFKKQMPSQFAKYRTELDNSFEDAKRQFDKETHESLTRKPIKTKDLPKIINPVKVILACFLFSGFKKTVDRLVR